MPHLLRTRAEKRRIPAVLIMAAGLYVVMGLVTPVTQAQVQVGEDTGAAGTARETAWQAASFLATIPYGAAKLGVAAAGGIIGGLGYVLSGGDLESSRAIWNSFADGTYVLSPAHLKGEEPVVFFVPPAESPIESQP